MKRSINIEDELTRLKKSFPKHLETEIEHLWLQIRVRSENNAHWGYEFFLKNNNLEMPIRIYWDENRLVESNN